MFQCDRKHTSCSSALGYMVYVVFVLTEVIRISFARTFLCLDLLTSLKNELSLSLGHA